MAGLLDFFQSASNAAASNVSAPVDGLAWMLRKLGAPIPANPVGGSDWMAEKGLTKPVEQSGYSLAGETAGMIGPMLAAAKAPQIAKGLLQGADNLAAPRTLNPQTGAVVWHGSPHKFNKFDAGKISTGEGNQVYGHGLYFAESPAVAQNYADDLSARAPSQSVEGIKKSMQWAMDNLQGPKRMQELSGLRADLKIAQQASRSGGPSVYKVDLPDEHIAKMLDWDKPLSQQSVPKESINSLLSLAGRKSEPGWDAPSNTLPQDLLSLMGHKLGGQDKVAEAMRQQGIPGIRYLDNGSRAIGGASTSQVGTSNFVVFPGNENLLSILERNGKAVK